MQILLKKYPSYNGHTKKVRLNRILALLGEIQLANSGYWRWIVGVYLGEYEDFEKAWPKPKKFIKAKRGAKSKVTKGVEHQRFNALIHVKMQDTQVFTDITVTDKIAIKKMSSKVRTHAHSP